MRPASLDVVPPTLTITVESQAKVSAVSGQDVTNFSFTVSEPYNQYQAMVVGTINDTVDMGLLLVAGPGGDGSEVTIPITEAELVAVSPGEGTKIVKIFAQDAGGNWST